MLTRVLPVIALSCAVANAHLGGHHHHVARQGTASSSGSTTAHGSQSTPRPTTTGGASNSQSGAPPPAGTTSPPASSVSLSFPPGSTATDAVPLDKIVPVAQQPSDTTTVPVATQTPGAKPSALSGAPGLPDISNWASMQANYPSPDPTVKLDTSRPEVQQWVKDVQSSGVQIPNIQPHYFDPFVNNCEIAQNQARAANYESEGWWTCGHYTRDSDVTECKTTKTWGSSFDDGPSDSTTKLLQYLDQQNTKTTFFVVGSSVSFRPQILQQAYIDNHQIAVHTWNHHGLTNLTNEEIIAEFGWTKKIIKDVIGVTPQYFRPPYGDIDDRVRAIAKAMNLTPVMWTVTGDINHPFPFDTFDFSVPSGDATAAAAVAQFQKLIAQAESVGKGFIVLEHDLYYQQVDLARGYFLPAAKQAGFNVVPIYQCAGQEYANAYFETRTTNSTPGGSTSGPSSGSSGGTGGNSNAGGNNTGGQGAATSSQGGVQAVLAALSAGALAVVAAL